MTQPTIRPATLSDVPVLASFNRAMAMETEGRDLSLDVLTPGVASLIGNPQYGFYLVAESAGQVAAALLVTYEWSDWRNGVFWWIQSVYVREENRRQGLYRRLYERVKSMGEQAGNVCGYRLYVERNNAAAQWTYASLGMDETHYVLFEEITAAKPAC